MRIMKIKKYIPYIYLSLLPIIDLITGIMTRLIPNISYLGIIIKAMALMIATLYIILSQYKKILPRYYLLIILFFVIFYFFTKPLLISKTHLFYEINYLAKYIYFPIVFIAVNIYFKKNTFNEKLINIILYVTNIFYMSFILVPTILKINYNTYTYGGLGSIGLFYAANEVSVIMLLTFPFLYKSLSFKNIILILLTVITFSLIGTKVALFGIVIMTILMFLNTFIKNKNSTHKTTLIALFIMLFSLTLVPNSYAVKNMKNNNNIVQEEVIESIINFDSEIVDSKLYIKVTDFVSLMLSDRDIYFKNTLYLFLKDFNYKTLLFGIGFSNTENIGTNAIEKLVEMDLADIFLHLGLIGLIIVCIPFIYLIKKSFQFSKLNKESLHYFLIILFVLAISFISGHVLMAPAVSIYLIIYMNYFLNTENEFKEKVIVNNKIQILAMHLGHGGAENAIINEANILSKKYLVEIICLYTKTKKPVYDISNKIKIKYLLPYSSNKKELLEAFKNRNIMNIFKETFKAIYILSIKNILIFKEIATSDAKIILSSRYEYSYILNFLGNEKIIKLHQEHNYRISKKYIKKLKRLTNIDYILPVSKALYKVYKSNNLNVVYLPLALSYYPQNSEVSNLDKFNLITVGRLEKVKGYDLLIEIISNIKTKNIVLNIFGDGSERDSLQKKIDELNLNDTIKLWGFKSQEEIGKFYKNSCLFIMTSRQESFGLVLIEAMSYGVPCIAFDSAVGANSTITSKNGFFIPAFNKEKMAKQIDDYLKMDISMKKKLGIEARKTANTHSQIFVAKKWLNFIEGVLK